MPCWTDRRQKSADEDRHLSPVGRGRRVAPGEGVTRAAKIGWFPLTLSLSPPGRGHPKAALRARHRLRGVERKFRASVLGVLLALLLFPTEASAQEKLAVDVVNASAPTLCAEADNVYVQMRSAETRRFVIEAEHPAYAGTIVADRWAPDFRNCDMSSDPAYKFEQRRVTLYETEEWQLIGYVFPSFWRPNQVPVKVGDRTVSGLHLLQVWKRFQERAEEVLVLYPADGYWRARPLPPPHLRWSAYGSSFLIGPVETSGRPLVDIRAVAFDPATRTFKLDFVRGGSATLRLDKLDQERIVLDVTLAEPVAAERPFAALRSMYVTEVNADVAHLAWRTKDGKAWRESPVMTFERAQAVELWAGRHAPSRHNTSAPDMLFRDFSAR